LRAWLEAAGFLALTLVPHSVMSSYLLVAALKLHHDDFDAAPSARQTHPILVEVLAVPVPFPARDRNLSRSVRANLSCVLPSTSGSWRFLRGTVWRPSFMCVADATALIP